ncbi:hypothetical protein TF3313_1153 [Tannerella forsythia 3313]|nr:hypothetical protein TF3313_1153 [Tannerella forsythia 3313]
MPKCNVLTHPLLVVRYRLAPLLC